MSTNTFNPETHEYAINGRRVPSVTEILGDVLGLTYWNATHWHLHRGTAVHAAAAMIAQGKQFDADPQITGQVVACQTFFEDEKPKVIDVETPGYNELYQFGGTWDLFALIRGRKTLVDWKSSLSEVAKIQLGGYAILNQNATHGMVVELGEDGRCRRSEHFVLKKYMNEFLACRSVYAIKQRLGMVSKKQQEENEDGPDRN